MNCDSVITAIPFYFYGELPAEQEEALEAHVERCPGCRRELERHKTVAAALDRSCVEPPPALLSQCRQDLMRSVTPMARAFSPVRFFQTAFSRLRQPLGALALVALGYFSGRIAPSLSPEPTISTVRSVQPDAAGGVQITVDEIRRRVISGRSNDGNIRRLLLAAARDESNPGVRVESMEILKDHPGSPEIRGVLVEALQHDPNPGVRLTALEALKGFTPDAEIRNTLTRVLLADTDPGIRTQAVDLLIQRPDSSMVGVLQHMMGKEENGYVRLRCRNALEAMNASVGTF